MTTSFAALPPIPEPPNDPTWWPLDPVSGWQDKQLDNVVASDPCGHLRLTVASGPSRALNESSGSMGRVVLPRNAALADGNLYLLDGRTPALKRFDPCACAFAVLPCWDGFGAGPRQLNADNGGIGIDSGSLFVCDTGNHRLSVWRLRELLLRAFWHPPAGLALTNEWEPVAVAFDSSGKVYVSDGANSGIHRFNRGGVWERLLPLPAAADALAVDRSDRLYAVSYSRNIVWILNADGAMQGTASTPADIRKAFPRAPFPIDPAGNVDLSRFCVTLSGVGMFDLRGNPLAQLPAIPPTVYETNGTYLSVALDSSISQCVWHRIVLRAHVPQGTLLQLATFTAEALLPPDQIAALPAGGWSTNLTVYNSAQGDEWDGLIRGNAGRYLWLRIRFVGHGSGTPEVQKIRVEFPRISLKRYLPAVFGADPVSADFTDRFLALFDTVFRSVEGTIDTQARFYDPMATPAGKGRDFLSWLASWVGVSFDRNWPVELRRRYLRQAVRLYSLRGTREGLRRQLLLLLGIDTDRLCGSDGGRRVRCRPDPPNCAPAPRRTTYAWQPPQMILEHFALRRWLVLGSGGLGDEAALWGQRIINRSQLGSNAQAGVTQLITTPDPQRDPFLAYAYRFTVFVPARYGQNTQTKRMLQSLLQSESPGYAAYDIEYVEPRFRIGVQSMIGYDTVIGRYPRGVTLGDGLLGSDTVLTAAL